MHNGHVRVRERLSIDRSLLPRAIAIAASVNPRFTYESVEQSFSAVWQVFFSMEDKTMKLIYRAHIYEYTPRPVQPYIKPRAINWRYQLSAMMHS